MLSLLNSGMEPFVSSPKKKLMFATLLDAVECFQTYAGHEANRFFKDMQVWIFEDDQQWPFSFIHICEAMGLDTQYLRQGAFALETQQSQSSKVHQSVLHTHVIAKEQGRQVEPKHRVHVCPTS
jgi:hypothetical protein